MSGVLRGGLGGSNPGRSGSWRISGRDLAAGVARVSPKTPEGSERQRARGGTHTVAWRTWAEMIAENVTYLEQLQKELCFVPHQGAPNGTHSKGFEHDRLGAHHVDEVALRILQMKQNET